MMTTKSAKSAARSAKKSAVAATTDLVLHSVEAAVPNDAFDAGLDDLIASLGAPEIIESDEVIETAVTADDVLEAAVSNVEATEAMVLEATPAGVVEGAAAPTGDDCDIAAAAAPEVEKKAKRVPVPRKHYSDKTERLKDKLGEGLAEYSVLTLADAGVTEEELAGVMEGTMVVIRAMSGKAQNWAVKLIEFLAGKKSSMSEVTARIFKLLEKDGFITTGNEGNLYLDLLAKPYSPGAARAMGGNNLAMMTHLKIIVADGKGRYVANPDSLLLMKANSMLFGTCEEEAAELTA